MRYVILALLCDVLIGLGAVGVFSGSFSSIGSGFKAFGVALFLFVSGLIVLVADIVFSVMAMKKDCMTRVMVVHSFICVFVLLFIMAGARL